MEKYTEEYYDDVIGKLANYSRHHYYFTDFDKVYPFTNEYITGYLDYVNFTGKSSALSVLSSGDHPFSLITNGITDIDTFDINGLTEFYSLGLKRAMIMKYSYSDFLKIAELFNYQMGFIFSPGNTGRFDPNEDIIKQLVSDLSKDMDEKYRTFWRKVVNSSDSLCKDKSVFVLNSIANGACKGLTYNIDYLKNEASYNLLRSRLPKANISFTQADISSVPEIFKDGKYDVVLFSNILDYAVNSFGTDWNVDKLHEFTSSVEKICSSDSVIFLQYLLPWRFISSTIKCNPLFLGSAVHTWDLKDYLVYNINAPGAKQGVVLKKIKRYE